MSVMVDFSFFFKQTTAYDLRISDWSSDVCSSDLEYLASMFLRAKHKERYDDRCWVSENRGLLEIDWEGDDTLGFDFRVHTSDVEWRYEVKSNINDEFEFDFSWNEMRIAAECSSDSTRKNRILYVPFVFDPSRRSDKSRGGNERVSTVNTR